MKRLAISAARGAGHAAMWPFERFLMKHDRQPAPPVFIIGAPRSGTSLLYELMITRFRFAYISNAAHRFYRTPLAATKLFARAISTWRGNFTSRFGHIDGWGAPNEGGWLWQRWLADGDWTDGAAFSDSDRAELRQLTAGFARTASAPFLNKNVMHSNRLLLMQRIWPEALFIEVQRNTIDNARSIVRAERLEGGPVKSADDWWSVRPKIASEFAGKPDTERAIAQVTGVAADIETDLASANADRLLRVDYADMCAAPQAILDKIADFAGDHGVALDDRYDVPTHFDVRPSRPLNDEDELVLAAALADRETASDRLQGIVR